MISISDTQINALIAGFVWPFSRIVALFMADPLFSTRVVPRRFKAGLALVLTVLLVPILPPMPAVPVVSGAGGIILAQQLLIGFAMGFVMRLVMGAVEFSGLLMSNQMGLGFAVAFDPLRSAQVPAVSQLLSTMTFLLFLGFDGHHVLIGTLAESFVRLPIGQSVDALTYRHLVEWAGHIFAWGLWLSLPVVTSLLVVNLAIGVMTRAAPQFNIFSFGFPLTLFVGFGTLYLVLPLLVPAVEEIYRQGFAFILLMLGKKG
ncbi:flagellar biosynthetic protein FliR [Paludibacterium paludis]|uniref:Flagellar biosynthetic protein FliR n=1 Tax=Paludibacterium paludis TaxID=1225769 RepID=A0A918U8E0_9NEIS|nr:flagellar biosynthetic protein FliR [Paludibacterium paludis]GGY11085.1 flagellar biosynthetic protein FliR [Paludibacterium paludis]